MIENWPPAKGPIPKHLSFKTVYQPTRPSSRDFRFKLPPHYRIERREMLNAILDHSHDKKIIDKISSTLVDDGTYAMPVRRQENVDLGYHVSTLSTLSVEQASRLIYGYGRISRGLVSELPPKPLRVKITYPLSLGVELSVRPFIMIHRGGSKDSPPSPRERRQTVGSFLWAVAQEYRRIYFEWKKYGIWAHAIDDLYFERLTLNSGGRVDLSVGSE